MYETYNKKGRRMVGEQTSAKFAPDGASPGYQQVGSKTSYPSKGHKGPNSRHTSREKVRSPFATAGGSKQVSASYPNKNHAAFPSEAAKNTLVNPTSRHPKAK